MRSPAACTIISRNYLSYARILAESWRRHEPGARFYLLVVDRLPEGADAGPGVRVVEPDELGLPAFYEMCLQYNVLELATAMKPSFLARLLDHEGEEAVIYLDADILVMRPLDEVRTALSEASLVLTPHLLQPLPLDGRKPGEQDILLAGAYNLGFLAVRACAESRDFLQWWGERLRDGCRIDLTHGLFVDQRWIDLVPGFFPSTVLLRDETCNVAYWNLCSRPLEHRGDRFFVNGRPLGFFHFSGFDPATPRVLSRHQDRTEVVPGTALAELLAAYAEMQRRNGWETCRAWGYGYARFDNGMAVHRLLRRLYLELDGAARRRFGNPFQTGGADTFLHWAVRPALPSGLSPFLHSIYRLRHDVAAAFPDVQGRDRAEFMRWAQTQGAREMGYDPGLAQDAASGTP